MTTGFARPNTTPPGGFNIEIGHPNGNRIDWEPVGTYQEAAFEWTHSFEPGGGAFTLHPDHRLVSELTEVGTTFYPVRLGRDPETGLIGHNGLPWTGRIMQRGKSGQPGREKCTFTLLDDKRLLQGLYVWVNNLFPPEVQFNITGKQNVKWGQPDVVAKLYLSEVCTRLRKPIYGGMPARRPGSFTYTNLDDIDSVDDLLDIVLDYTETLLVKQARFTQFDELLKDDFERLQMAPSMTLWDGTGTPPEVFNTESTSKLQSIIDYTSDDFLNLSLLGNVAHLWDPTPESACWVYNTEEVRDNRQVQFRTDSGQILSYDYSEQHAEVTRALVGGKSPAVLNDIIEIGANLAIQLLLNALAPGLGLGFVVGDLFDDIFFAYQQFPDYDTINKIGEKWALGEGFADNTAAWSLDSYAVGKNYLKQKGPGESLTITTMAGGADGRGITFGADNGTARRYRHGDMIQFWDRGNVVEQYCSAITVSDKPGERMREQATFGDDKRLQGPWTRSITGLQGLGATSRGIANSV